MTLTFKDKTQTVPQWAKETGIPASTIISRIGRGWSHEKTLTKEVFSNETKITKNDAEMWLNDCRFEDLPKIFREIIKDNATQNLTRYGAYIRRYFSKQFDSWFSNVYLKEKQNAKSNIGR
jgi:hypothetical protein